MSVHVISASAGSGKTYTLAEMMEEAIAKRTARPDAVVAITYTNKAAAELARRLRRRLMQAGHPVQAARIRDGYLGTIHSVCQRLIADLAFEAGTSPYPEPAPASYSDKLFSEVVGRQTEGAMATLAPLFEVLGLQTQDERSNSRFGRKSWREFLRDIVDRSRENRLDGAVLQASADASVAEMKALLGEPSGQPATRDLQLFASVDAVCAWVEQEIASQMDKKGKTTGVLRKQAAWIRDVRRTLAQQRSPAWVDLCDVNGGTWSAKKMKPIIGDLRDQFARHLSHPRFQAELESVQREIFGKAQRVNEAFTARKQSERLLDFEDMLAQAAEILRSPAARAQLHGRIDLLMVDEFQDTSPVQLEVVMALSSLAKRTVWVGDKKQGIFGFQGSDPSLMEAAMAAALDGQPPQVLPSSYRSRPPLVSFCSELFAAAFAPYGFGRDQVALRAACPEPSALMGKPALHLWSTIKPEQRPKEKTWEANGLARHIEDLLTEQTLLVRVDSDNPTVEAPTRVVRAGDIAVLARTNVECSRIASALQMRGVQALVAEQGLSSTPEALLTRAGLAILADPHDRLAAAEIAWFTGHATDPDAWLTERIERYTRHREDGTKDVAFADVPPLKALRAVAQHARSLSPEEAVLAVFCALDMPERTLSWPDPKRHFANLEALRAIALDYQATCGARRSAATIAGLVQHLDALPHEEGQALAVVHDAVRVLTYHKAKGLEWPVVVCAQLGKVFDPSPFDVRVRPADIFDPAEPLTGREIRWWPWPYGRKSKGLELGDKAHETDLAHDLVRRSKAENVRLLYVGFTRARDHLVLSKHAQVSNVWLDMLDDGKGRLLLDLPWANQGLQHIGLGGQGFACEVRCQVGTAPLEPASVQQNASWFERPKSITPRAPQRLTPSSQVLPDDTAANVVIAEVISIGQRTGLQVAAGRMVHVGEAIHDFFAADLGAGSDGREALAQRLIDHWGLSGQLPATTVVAMADRFHAWLDAHAPGARLPEWPVRWVRDDGRAMSGDVDLLVPVEGGWLLLDHKSFPGGTEERDERLRKWAGQLDAYREAVEAATGQAVTQIWVHLPVRGEMVRLEIPRA